LFGQQTTFSSASHRTEKPLLSEIEEVRGSTRVGINSRRENNFDGGSDRERFFKAQRKRIL